MKKHNPNDIEKCVLCGCDTCYKFSDNISTRSFYVEGAGQLCQSCFQSVYKAK